jgi:hypothetical protein
MRPRGLPKTGGRTKGTRNKATIARQKAIEESNLSSLGYLQSVYRDEKAPQQARIECAKAAAPFEFPRLAAIEYSDMDGPPIKIESLTDAQLDTPWASRRGRRRRGLVPVRSQSVCFRPVRDGRIAP